MGLVNNSLVYKEDWEVALQAELDQPNKWKEICNVVYSDRHVIHNPYNTDMTVQTHSRGTPYTYQAATRTDESATINTSKIAPQFIDRGDLADTGYDSQMYLAERQGILINEAIESSVYGYYASLTTFDNASIGGSAGSITVSINNIDEIVRGIQQAIYTANGESLLQRYGGFVVWTPAHFNILLNYMQVNGFTMADQALRGGMVGMQGVSYGGLTHYTSNLLTTNHSIAGVKKQLFLGILKSTYGQIVVDDKDPAQTSGISVVSRADYVVKAWAKTKPVLYDVQVTF